MAATQNHVFDYIDVQLSVPARRRTASVAAAFLVPRLQTLHPRFRPVVWCTFTLACGVMVAAQENSLRERPALEQESVSDHWSFLPIKRPDVPATRNAARLRNPIDAFVLTRLEAQRLAPSPVAERTTLVRRLSLDLLGLPPSPADVRVFLEDSRPDAYERLVDRLLASPHYGERWGRHWLDLARYADSNGFDNDEPRPFAWLYRDWVIDALNRDLPFDQFSVEQLAGDLLPQPTIAQRVATGFQRNTPTNTEGGVDREEFRVATVADRVNTAGTVWLGLTVGCARCHDHKYDPLSQREYYGLFAFYNKAQEGEVVVAEPDTRSAVLVERPDTQPTHVMSRGDYRFKEDQVAPHTPSVLHPLHARGPVPDRLDFARWLFDSANPLTARVAANRVWQHVSGRGLVATVEDFGTQGETPTHPELLDWLAAELMGRVQSDRSDDLPPRWSIKSITRRIVQSATYRQSSCASADLATRDPYNALLARQNRFRLEGEVLRDCALAASGLLHPTLGGPSFQLAMPPDEAKAARWKEAPAPERYRRGVYLFVQRTVPYPLLALFDGPDSHVTCTRRDRSNTALQALSLLNDPVFVECAQAFGVRIIREQPGTVSDRIRCAFRLCLAREPDDAEAARLEQLYQEQLKFCREHPDSAVAVVGTQPLPDGVDATESAAWFGVARTLINLDEFMMRE